MSQHSNYIYYTVVWKIKDEYGGGTREVHTREHDEAVAARDYVSQFPEIEELKLTKEFGRTEMGRVGHGHLTNGTLAHHDWELCDVNPDNALDDIGQYLYKEEEDV